MNNRQKARWENAKRFGNKIITLLEKGCAVFDSDGVLVQKMEVTDEGVFQVDEVGKLIIFLNDTELDNGMYTTVTEFNKRYSDWTFIEPQNKNKVVW